MAKTTLKIALFDHVKKFSGDLVEHWESQGHEVRKDRYFHPLLTEWADISFFEFCDNSIQCASNPDHPLWAQNKLKQSQGKNIIVRCHDIDAWVGEHVGVNWDWVTNLVFVADHIKDKVVADLKQRNKLPSTLKIHKINHGIDLDRFTYRERKPGNKIAWVGNICHHKCLELALQVMAENPEYELHVVGTSLDRWEKAYVEGFVKRNKIKFFYQPRVDDINEFLEDKSYLLLTSFKEAFSYITGEAMAKGIKPLIHNFYGAENIWPKKYIWNKASEVKDMVACQDSPATYNSQEYRDFIKDNYSLEEMLKNYEKLWRK